MGSPWLGLIFALFGPTNAANFANWGEEKRMRKLIVAFAAIAVLTLPAHAQNRGKGSKRSDNTQQTEDKKKRDAAAEKALSS
jgi:hypothetical protein